MDKSVTYIWLARDENGYLFMYPAKPTRYKDGFLPSKESMLVYSYDDEAFPEVTWENSPVKVAVSYLDLK